VTTDRPTRDTIESLRLTLERVEQSIDPSADAQEIAELKRILLARIADLEAVTALEAQSPMSSAVVTAEEPTKETVAETAPETPPTAD
jgi:hypothetical protein